MMVETCAPDDSQHVYRTRALGTIAEVVTDSGTIVAASQLLRLELDHIDQVASRFRIDSELSRLNAAAGSEVVVGHDLFEAIEVALAMAEATDGMVDPTVGAAMNRLGYDRDFAEVLPGVDGELPPDAPRRGGGRSPSIGAAALSGSHAHIPGPRSDSEGARRRPSGGDHQPPARVWSARLTGGRRVRGWPRTRRRIRHRHRRHLHLAHPRRGNCISSGGLATSGIGVRQWRLGSHQVHHIVDPGTGLPATLCWRTVSRPRQRVCRRTRRARLPWCSASTPWAGWRVVSFRRGLCGSTELLSTPRAGPSRTQPASARGEHPLMTSVLATVGHGSSALWYLTAGDRPRVAHSAVGDRGARNGRLGGWTSDRWPRFLSQSLHRNLSLFCIAIVGVHVVTTVGDGYVPIGVADAILPFRSPYRPLWVGLGAMAFDMLLAVAITSALRRRIGVAAWRGVHWLAYACWPVAVMHGLGSGSDARLPGAILVFLLCIAAVAAAVAWRLAAGWAPSITWRLGGAVAGAAVLVVITAFAVAGPLRPGWSHRAGTSSALLAQLSGATSASYSSPPPSTTPSTSAPPASGIPTSPFETTVSGTVATSPPNGDGDAHVALGLRLADSSVPLEVRIIGPAVNGGVALHRSEVTFGPLRGQVTALDGSTIGAFVTGPTGSLSLTMNLSLNSGTGTLTGQLSGSAAQ